jgi:hypothetical protein
MFCNDWPSCLASTRNTLLGTCRQEVSKKFVFREGGTIVEAAGGSIPKNSIAILAEWANWLGRTAIHQSSWYKRNPPPTWSEEGMKANFHRSATFFMPVNDDSSRVKSNLIPANSRWQWTDRMKHRELALRHRTTASISSFSWN